MSGAVVNAARLAAIARTYRALFFQALERGQDELAAMALPWFLEVTSTGAEENYNWIGDVPQFEEWTGDRPHAPLRADGFYLRNKNFATGIICSADDIEDDRLNMIAPRINGLVTAYGVHIFTEMVRLIEEGSGLECYDGKNFFATDHSTGSSGTQINYSTGGGSALSSSTFRTYRARMMEYKNDRGVLMAVKPTHLFCGTSLEGTAEEILKAERLSTGETNVDRNKCEIMVIPGLASSTMWGLADLSKPIKPFIKQNRRPLDITALTDPTSPDYYNDRTCKFGADYRGAYGVGLWQLAYLADGA